MLSLAPTEPRTYHLFRQWNLCFLSALPQIYMPKIYYASYYTFLSIYLATRLLSSRKQRLEMKQFERRYVIEQRELQKLLSADSERTRNTRE